MTQLIRQFSRSHTLDSVLALLEASSREIESAIEISMLLMTRRLDATHECRLEDKDLFMNNPYRFHSKCVRLETVRE